MDDKAIPHYRFIDTTGKLVVEPEFLNLTQFDNGYATAIYFWKDFDGKNKFNLNIYDYSFTKVIVNKSGEWFGSFRKGKIS